jgi:hypothetical protein
MVAHDVYDTFSSYGFTVIPAFILMGQIAFNGELQEDCMIPLTNLLDTSQGD